MFNLIKILTLAFLFFGIKVDAQEVTNEGEDKTLSPYFFVKSEDTDIDNLPLLKTSADVRILGVIADVTVRQVYKNSGKKPLEAVYTFPSSTRAAVYSMKMKIGKRILIAEIQEKQKAREIYEQAKKAGKSTSLLEQQRPNVFQMNVANIMPGDIIEIEMRYTELLIPDDGVYQFVYPTVVGPRYSNKTKADSKPEDQFVNSPYTREGREAFYDFDIAVEIKAGMQISELYSPSHKLEVLYSNGNQDATAKLASNQAKSGNKDYIINFRLSGDKIQTGLLLSGNEKEKFFLLMLQPPKKIRKEDIPPREFVFVVDVSGSMHGYPLDISKSMMKQLLESLSERDLFNVLLFAGSARFMNCQSVPATKSNIDEALEMISREQGGGGTELISALEKVYNNPKASGYSRSIIILTDGFIEVEKETFDIIRKNLNVANLYSFGIGTSVNRYLIEGMARAGIGEPFFVTHPKYSDTVTAKFRKYISTPVLTDIKIDFKGFSAYDVEPKNIPDVSEQRPIIIYGKWNGSAQGSIRISGRNDEQELQVEVPVKLFAGDESNDALKYLWARNKIAELSDYIAIREDTATVKAVTEIGMKYNLLTKYTSFVAVDYEIRNNGKDLIKVNQPLPLPEGVSDQAIGDAGMSANAFSPSPSGYGVGRSLSYSSMKKVGKFYSGVVSAEVDEVQVIDDSNIIDLKAAELTKINAEFKGFLVYPPKVIEKGIDGKVVLWVLLDKTGYPVYTEMVETVSGGLYVAAMNALSKVNLLPVKQVTSDTYFWRKFEINFDLEKKSADIIDISEDILFDATIQSVDLKNGTGEPINDGDTVVINYTSVSSDCSILENQEKNTIVYGERSINRAITGILTGMSVGGRRKASVTELYFAPENYATIIQKQLKINLEIEVIEIRRKKSE